MSVELTALAARLVRVWTRLYTHGLPAAERIARRAEIDSDLWEFEHDPERPHGIIAAAQVVARLLIGIPDDLAWRMEARATEDWAPVSVLAAGGIVTGPRRVSAFGLSAIIHVIGISAALWLPWSYAFIDQPVALPPDASSSTDPRTDQDMPPEPGSLLSAQAAEASLDRFIAKVLENRYSLAVRNGQLSGTGAPVLQSAIAQARFVLLGETHGLAQNAELAAAVCRAAGPEPFHAMAREQGPLAASALESWAQRRDGLAQLTAFRKTFPDAITLSREEFEMLQHCSGAAQGDFHLWGLTQEGLGAAGLILSRILETPLGKTAGSAMRELLQKNEAANRKALQSGSIEDLFMLSADDQDFARGAAALERDGTPEARSLFASLIESREINRVSPANYDNARRREQVMKTRFATEYAQAVKSAKAPPRVLLKFGAFHIYRGLNPVGGYGIGNYVAEFAERERAQSLHVRLIAVKGAQPIYPKFGQPAEQRAFDLNTDPRARSLWPMLNNRLESDWTLFDLRPLRQDFRALVGTTNTELETLVLGIDMLVVVPEGTPVTDSSTGFGSKP